MIFRHNKQPIGLQRILIVIHLYSTNCKQHAFYDFWSQQIAGRPAHNYDFQTQHSAGRQAHNYDFQTQHSAGRQAHDYDF